MGMSRCYSFMKCLLILCCIIFMCVGWAACGLAGWALWEGQGRAARAGLGAAAAWGLALGAGAALALCGAARRAPAPLLAGLALLTVTAAAEGAAAWWGADHLPQLRAALLDRLRDTVRYDYGLAHTHTQLIDAIQQGLECCGADGVRDWQRSAWQRVQSDAATDTESAASSVSDLALDLSVSAEPSYYWVPPSCCLIMQAPEFDICNVSQDFKVETDAQNVNTWHGQSYYGKRKPLKKRKGNDGSS